MATAWLVGAAVVWVAVTALWLVSVRVKDVSIIDSFWGPGFGLAATAYAVVGGGDPGRVLLVLALTWIWGLRLGLHILRRNHGRGEDPRYQAFRQTYGPERYWWFSYFQVFLLQGALVVLISAPLVFAVTQPAPLGLFDIVGALVWAIGFAFEAIGDGQLARFKADPANRGQVMDRGLWRYTRHPNYFGNACLWWGLWLIACSTPWGWATMPAPILMTFLLLRVSGVALLEQTMKTRPGYAEYAARTSAFIPWPPRIDASRPNTTGG